MSKKESVQDEYPLGGIFVGLGGLVGLAYGWMITENFLIRLGGLMLGATLGLIVEHILFRLIIIGLIILMFMARSAFIDAVFTDASIHTPSLHDQQFEQIIADPNHNRLPPWQKAPDEWTRHAG